MRAYNIVALVVVIVLLSVTAYYMDATNNARWASYFSDYDYGYGSYGNSYYGSSAASLTEEAGSLMLLFIAFFTAGYIGNLVRVKTMTSRVMCIIGLSFTLLVLLINVLVLLEPRNISFDESGAFFFIYGIIDLAFFIVLLVQSVKYANRNRRTLKADSSILDMEIE